MPTAKHVRFASTNVLYSDTSPPSTLPWGDSFTKRRRGDSFSGVASSSSSSSYLQPGQQETIIGRLPIQRPPPPRSRSRTSSLRSSSSSRSSSPRLNPHSLYLAPPCNHHHHQTPLQLHYLLAYSPFKNSCIKYDLSLPPFIFADHYPSSSLLEPATNPSVSSLTITSPDLPWTIFVTPSPLISHSSSAAAATASSSSGAPTTPYITVVDVLNTLYHELRTPVHKSEYDSVKDPSVRKEIDAAFWRRCRRWRSKEKEEEETKKGVKRVDFLMGQNRFLGLSGARKGGVGVWELNLGG